MLLFEMKIIFNNYEKDNLSILKKSYTKYGLIVLKNFYDNDKVYEDYNKDLEVLIRLVYRNKNIKRTEFNKLYNLRKNNDKIMGSILDLGSKKQ